MKVEEKKVQTSQADTNLLDHVQFGEERELGNPA